MNKAPQLDLPFPAVGDKEDDKVPPGLPGIVDTHVHVFPAPVFKALWEGNPKVKHTCVIPMCSAELKNWKKC